MNLNRVGDIKRSGARDIHGLYVVISKNQRKTREGKLYWDLVLADSSGQIAGRIWNVVEDAGLCFESGHILEVVASVKPYAGEPQLNIQKFRRMSPRDVDLADFPKGTSGAPDEFATLKEFKAESGVWVFTDSTTQIARATEAKTEELKKRFLRAQMASAAGATEAESQKQPTTIPIKPRPVASQSRLEELKRKYLKVPPEEF